MTNLTHRFPVAVRRAADTSDSPGICRIAPLYKLPGISRSQLAYSPLPLHRSAETLLAEFKAAPQFASVRPERLLAQQRGRLQVILLTESDYYARQAALYLAAINRLQRPADHPGQKKQDDFWDVTDLKDLFDDTEEDAGRLLQSALAVVSAAALDPELQPQMEKTPASAGPPAVIGLARLDAPAVLITSDDPTLLSKGVLEQIDSLNDRDTQQPMDLFIALRPEQIDLETIEDLRFRCGFQVCRIGMPDRAYLGRVLTTIARDLLMPLADDADPDAVIAHVRTLRGAQFDETDLERLICWAVQRNAEPPLHTRDLLFAPLSLGQSARQELDRMIGLQPVKDRLHRLLARMTLDRKRLHSGLPVAPVCRNMAFAGPPGTGKSVTARLLARAMKEAGCGTGRFVEVGREQLIGPYLGQTSPMVAGLFQQAKGGVLFIDEAGALLDRSGQDNYCTEAVNALVRHMELCPETMVIFATYPDEMEALLGSNPGLSSRIAHVLDFTGYDDDQLCRMLAQMAKKENCRLPGGYAALCSPFFAALRRQKGQHFGNGREVRRLFQAALEELALRICGSDRLDLNLTDADLRAAMQGLLQGEKTDRPARIGF